MAKRLPDGGTLREHLQALARTTGKTDERLLLQVPRGCVALWECFLTLNASRPAAFGVSAIAPSEIDAWQRLHGVRLSVWEVETLEAMDRAVLSVIAEEAREGKA